jgi:hypothetical protein
MSQEIFVAQKPLEIEEHHAFLKWIDRSIERSRPTVKSFSECNASIQTFANSISTLLPVIQIFPVDAKLTISNEENLNSWMSIDCCSPEIVHVSFSVGSRFGERKVATFERTLCQEAEKLGLYVVFDREILVGTALRVDPTKDPTYREEQAKDRIRSKMRALSNKFEEHIRAHIDLSSPIEFEFIDHMHHPHIAIKCSPQDFDPLYVSFDKCRPGLFKILKTLKGISKANVGFQIVRRT